jgi:hypothetical protein
MVVVNKFFEFLLEKTGLQATNEIAVVYDIYVDWLNRFSFCISPTTKVIERY